MNNTDTTQTEPNAAPKRMLVLFDFDHTLIKQESLILFISDVMGGKLRAYGQFVRGVFSGLYDAATKRNTYMDWRSEFKAQWMLRTLRGLSVEQAQQHARSIKHKVAWRHELTAALKKYADDGADIVIATGAPDIYIHTLMEDYPVTHFLCTHMEVEDNTLTGRMRGDKDVCNAVREEKRKRVLDYIETHGPYARVIGYGNMPNDGPMLALCDEFVII